MRIAIISKEDQNLDKYDPFNFPKNFSINQSFIVNLSRELTKRGHEVFVFADPVDQINKSEYGSWKTMSIYYLSRDRYDLGIMVDRCDHKVGKMRCEKLVCFLNYHEIPDTTIELLKPFDKVVTNMTYLYNQLVKRDVKITKIPIYYPEVESSEKEDLSVGFFGDHTFSLDILLSIWKEIHEQVPGSKLYLCCGDGLLKYTTIPREKESFKKLLSDMKQPGITVVPLSEQELIMKKCKVVAVPYTGNNLFNSGTCIKFQQYSCIPVVMRSFINEDLFPPTSYKINLNRPLKLIIDDFKKVLILALKHGQVKDFKFPSWDEFKLDDLI